MLRSACCKYRIACLRAASQVMPALISLAFHPPATAHSLTKAAPRRRRRSILVFFRGSADLHEPMAQADWLRARLLATLRFKNDSDCRRGWLAPPQCQIHGLDVYISEQPASAREYVREMRDSIFCLAPPGYALWTYRFFEAISSGCIPVLFDERTQRLPFDDLIAYDSFVVRIGRSAVPQTLDILAAIPMHSVEVMRRRMRQAARLLLYSARRWSVLDAMAYELARVGAVQHCVRQLHSAPAVGDASPLPQTCGLAQFVV
jgi:hypothetical protein